MYNKYFYSFLEKYKNFKGILNRVKTNKIIGENQKDIKKAFGMEKTKNCSRKRKVENPFLSLFLA